MCLAVGCVLHAYLVDEAYVNSNIVNKTFVGQDEDGCHSIKCI